MFDLSYLLFIVLVFFVIALLIAMFGPQLGIGGSEMAFKIAKIFLVILIICIILQVLFGGSFFGNGFYVGR